MDHSLNLDTTLDGTPLIVATGIVLLMVWYAAWVDIRTGRIPNAISVVIAVIGLLIAVEDRGMDGLLYSLGGLALGIALMLPGYLLRSTGAGDVKLMGAIGTLLGAKSVLLAFVISILVGAMIGLSYALMAGLSKGAAGPFERYSEMWRFLMTTGRFSYSPPGPGEVLGQRFAFGVPIAIGATAAACWPL